jgi:hypothetical protein
MSSLFEERAEKLKAIAGSAASRHDHDGRDRDFWSGMTEILVSDGSVFWR